MKSNFPTLSSSPNIVSSTRSTQLAKWVTEFFDYIITLVWVFCGISTSLLNSVLGSQIVCVSFSSAVYFCFLGLDSYPLSTRCAIFLNNYVIMCIVVLLTLSLGVHLGAFHWITFLYNWCGWGECRTYCFDLSAVFL